MIQSPIREHSKFDQVLVIYLVNFVKQSVNKTNDDVGCADRVVEKGSNLDANRA